MLCPFLVTVNPWQIGQFCLQHTLNLRVFREWKWEIGFEEYLEYVKGAPSRLFFHQMFEELGRHAKRGGSQECPNCWSCKESVEHVLFECASHDSQK